MQIETINGQILTIRAIGEMEKNDGSNKVTCLNDKGEKVEITFSEITKMYGFYAFPPVCNKRFNK